MFLVFIIAERRTVHLFYFRTKANSALWILPALVMVVVKNSYVCKFTNDQKNYFVSSQNEHITDDDTTKKKTNNHSARV